MKYAEQILLALNRFLAAQGAKTIEPKSAFFAFETDVRYECEPWVAQTKTFALEDFEELLAPHFLAGYSWIHANAAPTSDGNFLVTLLFGAPVGNPQPTLNLSYEPGQSIKIINSPVFETEAA